MLDRKKGAPANPERRSLMKGAAQAATGAALASATAATGLVVGASATTTAKAAENPPAKGSMMFMRGHNMIGARTESPGAPADHEVPYREFDLSFDLTEHTLLPGVTFPVFAFNNRVPGPVFRVQENDWIKVNVTNNTEEMHTVHWHGLDVIYTMDGVPMVTQDPIHPAETFVYRFQARPAGTRFYHCHWSTPLHMMSALHGAFIIDSVDDPVRRRFPYERDYVLMLEAFDVNWTRKHINEVLGGMKRVNKLMAMGRLDPITHGFFKDWDEMEAAIADGWVPPWTRGAAEGSMPEPQFFAINGRSYPATEKISIRSGEYIRIRLINGGFLSHHMHLHGHNFWLVAEDGNPLAEPIRLNTVSLFPGKTADIVVYGDNPGFWTFHDHDVRRVMNNGIYPGGMLTLLAYEDMGDVPYVPSIAINE
ncbi:MAG: multicopper oxidase domain-containing protein [Alphaproteobacteria bacterium]|jgi:manganese oxidase|nr:multicopper oxidase domain-containing protein [Alphaproteobacteria bacterium]